MCRTLTTADVRLGEGIGCVEQIRPLGTGYTFPPFFILSRASSYTTNVTVIDPYNPATYPALHTHASILADPGGESLL